MRSIIKLIVVLAIIAAVGYGGVRGGTWYKVKHEVDAAIQQAAPFADITYSSVYVSPLLDGTVGLDGIVIRPKMSPDEFKIQSVRLSFGNIIQLYKSGKKEMANRMHFAITGVNLDLNSPLLISLSQMQQQAMLEQSNKSGFDIIKTDSLGCGSIESIGLEELTRMGYSTMEIDVEMSYDYEKVKNLLNMDMAVRLKGMQGMNMKAQMRVAPSDVLQGKEIKPVINSMRLEVVDAGYATQRNRFCAAQLQANEETYLARHIDLLSREIGATLPPETLDAYKQFMQGNGRMTLLIEPKTGVDLETIGAYPVKDAIDLLGLQVTLDKHAVDFSKFEWGKRVTTQASAEGAEEGGSASESQTNIPVPARYRATAASQLKRYVGYQARVKTERGVQRDGVIESADGGTLTMRVHSTSGGRGYISFPIDMSEIVSAEVLY
ncbi:MAG TPA: hypothetical protein VGE50_09450 [Gammaproteobacteria bacterium]